MLKIDYIDLTEPGIENDLRQSLQNLADYQKLFANYRVTTLRQNMASVRKLGKILDAAGGWR